MSVERVAFWPACNRFGNVATDGRGTWQSAGANEGPQGSDAFTVICVLAQLRPLEASTNSEAVISTTNGYAFGGWRYLARQGGSYADCFAVVEGGVNRTAIGPTSYAPGRVRVGVGSLIVGTTLGIYVGGADTEGPVPASYMPNNNGSNFTFGATVGTGSFPATTIGLVALLATDSAGLLSAQREAAHDIVCRNLAERRSLDAGLSAIVAPEYYWDPRDIDWVNGTWTDRIGGVVMNRQGTLQRCGFPGRAVGAP